MRKFLIIVCVWTYSVGALADTPLADLAEQMKPGDWARLDTIGFDASLLAWENHWAFQYTDNLTWDPVRKEVHFVGSGHNAATRHLSYSEETNTWTRRPLSLSFGIHAYDHLAIDPTARRLYVRQSGPTVVRYYNLDQQTWTAAAAAPRKFRQTSGVEWLPGPGRLIVADEGAGLLAYNPASNSWQVLQNSIAGICNAHNFAEFSPTHNVIIYGGGVAGDCDSRVIYAVNGNMQVERKQDAPFTIAITETVLTTDPVSGNFIVVRYDDGHYYEYDPTADRWSDLGQPPGVIAQQPPGTVATPISTHGVILFGRYLGNGDASEVWLYRHSPGVGVPVDPDPPPLWPSALTAE